LPANVDKIIADGRAAAKRKARSLLDRSLGSHCLELSVHEELIVEISKALGLVNTSMAKEEEEEEEDVVVVMEKSKRRRGRGGGDAEAEEEDVAEEEEEEEQEKKRSTKAVQDEHNEACEVCETGGDLLCCDTCTLVFHIACVRPKLTALPTGNWSCAHCIVDKLGEGDVALAKAALRRMSRLNRGVDSGDEDDVAAAGRISRSGEITVIRTGKRFIVRKSMRSQIEELGRFNTLDDALSCVSRLTTSNSSSNNKRRSDSPDDGLWCLYCLDDPSIKICAFCGCRKCFGKHDSDFLLLCDGCDEESHTYCLSPPLTMIPFDSWYCGVCIAAGKDTEEAFMMDEDEEEEGGAAFEEGYEEGGEGEGGRRKKKKGPGRPRMGRPHKRPKDEGGGNEGKSSSSSGGGGCGNEKSKDKHDASTTSMRRNSAAAALKANEEATHVLDASGIDAALTIVSRASKRPLSAGELSILEQMRTWACLSDLEAVFKALVTQRDNMQKRIIHGERLIAAAAAASAAAAAAASAAAAEEAETVAEAEASVDVNQMAVVEEDASGASLEEVGGQASGEIEEQESLLA